MPWAVTKAGFKYHSAISQFNQGSFSNFQLPSEPSFQACQLNLLNYKLKTTKPSFIMDELQLPLLLAYRFTELFLLSLEQEILKIYYSGSVIQVILAAI